MTLRCTLTCALAALACVAVPAPASASAQLQIGIVDHAEALYGNASGLFSTLSTLRAQVLRVNLYWGGRAGVSRRRPENGADPADRAYDWRVYDRIVLLGERRGIQIAFSIFGAPGWANGGLPPTSAPRNAGHLRKFAYAAATRYSGTYRRPDRRVLPAVRLWMAWNEPNLRLGLIPQYRRVRGRLVIQSAIDYARICNAIYDGVHQTGLLAQRVACGVTAPRGNDDPGLARPSVSPLRFLRALKKAGARTFDAYAHQPYYGGPSETPSTRPRTKGAITLGNIRVLQRELNRLYGPKRLWITEYGYQTRPPDRIYGVTWAAQARYLTQAFAIARKNPGIDMMLWFLVRDETRIDGWQSGLLSASGARKPAYEAFRRFPRSASWTTQRR